MSGVDATRWAWSQQGLRPIQKLILLSLAYHADSEFQAFPSYESLREDTGADRKTIWQALKSMVDMGLLSDTGKRLGATRGVIVWQLIGVQSSSENVMSKQFRKRNGSENGAVPFLDSSSSENGIGNKPRNKPEDISLPPLTPPSTRSVSRSGLFDEFWRAYPRKCSKGAAERAFAKINPDEQLCAAIIRGVELAKTLDPRFRDREFTPHPKTWLNAKGWMDEFDQEPAKPATSSAYAGDPKPATSSAYGKRGRNRAEREQATNITILQEWLDDERRQSGGIQPALAGPG